MFWVGITIIQLSIGMQVTLPVQAVTLQNPPEKREIFPQEVIFPSGSISLEGTLLFPPGKQLPAAVLIQGTGPLDRDETIGAKKPFRDIAKGLALLGVATLRFDKRNYTYFGQPEVEQFTVEEEVIVDVLNALTFLRKNEATDPHRIFVIGHSLGGAMIPYIAIRDSLLAGAIMLAPPARSPEEIATTQTEFQMRLQGRPQTEIDSVIASVVKVFSALRVGREISYENFLGYPTAYWHEFLRREPLLALSETNVPILILQGLRDFQVTMDDFDLWLKVLSSRPAGVFIQKIYPTLDHTFVHGSQINNLQESCFCGNNSLPRQVDQTVIDDIAQFIKER